MNLTLETIFGADEVAPPGYAGGAFCDPSDGGAGCGTTIVDSPRGVIPPAVDGTGSAGAWNTGASYTLVAGLVDSGRAIEHPDELIYTAEDSHQHSTWLCGFWFKVGSLAAEQGVIAFAQATSAQVYLSVLTTGQWRFSRGSYLGGTTLRTSNETTTADAIVHVEIVYTGHTSTGSFRVKINGVELTWDGATTGLNTSSGTATGIYLKSSVATVDSFYVYSGDSGFAAGDTWITDGRLPRMTTMRPVSQGNQNDFDRYSGTKGTNITFIGAGNTTNYQYVDDDQADSPLTHLRAIGTGSQDSWIMGGLEAEADAILVVQTSMCNREEADPLNDSHEWWISGTAYNISAYGTYVDSDYTFLLPGGQWKHTTRHWPSRPSDFSAWSASDLSAPEIGLKSLAAVDVHCSQALIIVLWLSSVTPSASDGLYTLAQTGVDW